MPGAMAPTRKCGEALIGLLEQAGFDTAFGIPGVHTLELYRGLATSGIRHVLARHEQGAGFMADGFARASGRPALCVVITGPGVTNIATAMGQAYSDSVPMMIVSSVNARRDLGKGRGRLHESADQLSLTRPLTGYSAVIEHTDTIPFHVEKALAAIRGNRPRPAHLHIPIDTLAEAVRDAWSPPPDIRPSEPDSRFVNAARALLREAERPVIIAGGGAIGASAELKALAEDLAAVVVTTTAGKGVVPETSPLSLGATLALKPTQGLLAEADVVLAVGTELAETDIWGERPLRLGKSVIRVDVDAAKLSDDHRAAVRIRADAKAFFRALGPLRKGRNPAETELRVRRTREAIGASWGTLAQKHIQVLDVLRQVLPSGAFVATDMTQIAYTGNSVFPVETPRSWFHPVGFGTLGYALPAAIGAKIAVPERPGIALAGDFGFQFTLQELGTAVELGLHLPVVIWNNNGLGQIRDDMVAAGIQEIGVSARNPDFSGLAQAYGCASARPASLDQLGDALERALGADRPTVIEVGSGILPD